MIRLLSSFIFYCLGISLYAQVSVPDWEIAYSVGRIVPHSEKFAYHPRGVSQFFRGAVLWQTGGTHDWTRYYGFPRVGVQLYHGELGAPQQILGDVWSINPFLDFNTRDSNKWSMYVRTGFGMAYLTKPFHIVNNPIQTAIGSHYNISVNASAGFQRRIGERMCWRLGIYIAHFSNGNRKAPNLGLNIFQADVSLRYSMNRPARSSDLKIHEPRSKWSSQWLISYAAKEGKIIGGPSFPVVGFSDDIAYQYKPYRYVRTGMDLEYHGRTSYWLYRSELESDTHERWKKSVQIQAFASHEWLFGDLSFEFRLGYLLSSNEILNVFRLYNKLTLLYQIPISICQILRPNIGFCLKSYQGAADHFAMVMGLRFERKTAKHKSNSHGQAIIK